MLIVVMDIDYVLSDKKRTTSYKLLTLRVNTNKNDVSLKPIIDSSMIDTNNNNISINTTLYCVDINYITC